MTLREKVAACRERGLTWAQAAAEAGCSYDQARDSQRRGKVDDSVTFPGAGVTKASHDHGTVRGQDTRGSDASDSADSRIANRPVSPAQNGHDIAAALVGAVTFEGPLSTKEHASENNSAVSGGNRHAPEADSRVAESGTLPSGVIRSVGGTSVEPREVMGRIGRRIAVHGIGAPGRYHVAHVSDLHAGSKHFDGKALLDFLRFAKGRGLCGVVSTGDNIDGTSEKLLTEQRAYGMDEQHQELVDIFAEAAPGVPVWSISGNHDGYCDSAAGTDSGAILATKMRERGIEWHHLGQCLGRVILHGAKIELWHGAGGAGTKNSVRRVLNHRAEGYLPGDAPQVLLVGHYHRDAQFVATEGILCVSGRTFQRKRSEFANRIAHPWDVGGGILSWTAYRDGTAGEFSYESFPYMAGEVMGWAA